MNNKVFRKTSVERLSSPEQLDSLIQVASPKSWLALLSVFLLLAAALGWGYFGSMSIKLNGQGILILPGGVREIAAPAGGRISDMRAAVNETVHKGDVLARLEQPELLAQIRSMAEEMNRLRSMPGQPGADSPPPSVIRRMEELERKHNSLLEAYYLSSRVVSPFTGRILEVKAKTGDTVNAGTPIVTLEPMGVDQKTLEAVMYIPAAEGKKVLPGMEVQLSPFSINKQQYGFLLGQVISVSDLPASKEGMMITLGNQALVEELSGTNAQLEVRIDLRTSSETGSGYQWSTETGPPLKLSSGTLARGSIVLKTQRPLAVLFPQMNGAGR